MERLSYLVDQLYPKCAMDRETNSKRTLNLPTFGGQRVTLCHDIHDRRLIHARTIVLTPTLSIAFLVW
jgi:hypothetical protein